MKVLHLSTSDIDGGAARGAYWLHKALQQAGTESNMLVADKRSDDFTVFGPSKNLQKKLVDLRVTVNNLPLHFYKHRDSEIFSPAWIPTKLDIPVRKINPDIINLHWVCYSFLNPKNLAKFERPIIWTNRDMWAFTGGCHYSGHCEKYKINCGACPHLKSQTETDITRMLWQTKSKYWRNLNLTMVTISHWLADCAKQSSLFKNHRIEVIHNALNPSEFKPLPKNIVREILNLPKNKKIVLFGALKATEDKRKGFEYLIAALQKLAQSNLKENIELLVFGSSQPQNPPDLGMKATYMGKLNDDISIALVYAAADVTVVPSTQEAFGKTAMESLACGTPVVSFDSTGLKDIVEHQKNGYRAKCFSADDLANGIAWVLQEEPRWQALSRRAREKVEQEFTLEIQARAYLKLYEEVLQASNSLPVL